MDLNKVYALRFLSLIAKRGAYKHFYDWKITTSQKQSNFLQLPLAYRSAINTPSILSPTFNSSSVLSSAINSPSALSPTTKQMDPESASFKMGLKNFQHRSTKSSIINFNKNPRLSKLKSPSNTDLFNEIKCSLLNKMSNSSSLKTIIESNDTPKKLKKKSTEKNKKIKHKRTATINDVAVVSSKIARTSDIGFNVI